MKPSWEVELDSLFSNFFGDDRSFCHYSQTSASTTKSNALIKLHELLSLSASQILELKVLDSVGECLNDLAVNDLLNNETVTHMSSILERTREYFDFFEKALRAKDDFKVARVAEKAFHPKVKAIKVKKEQLANIHC